MVGISDMKAACLVLTGVLAFPMTALSDVNLLVAPVEILKDHPLCKGSGSVSYRVAFDAKGIQGRLGDAGASLPSVCTIKTRRGAQVTEVPIPCAITEQGRVAREAPKSSPLDVNLTGSIFGCLSPTAHEIVDANWQVSAKMATGEFKASGTLSNLAVTVLYKGPTVKTSGAAKTKENRVNPAVWVLILNELTADKPASPDPKDVMTTYLVMPQAELKMEWCISQTKTPENCRPLPLTSWNLSSLMDSSFLRGVMEFVHQEEE
jgi:hypothetical protein